MSAPIAAIISVSLFLAGTYLALTLYERVGDWWDDRQESNPNPERNPE